MLTQEVKNNIINALSKGELNNKVMTGDHVVSDTERDRFILPYDNTKRKIGNKLKTHRRHDDCQSDYQKD
jgi:hypothetical protein